MRIVKLILDYGANVINSSSSNINTKNYEYNSDCLLKAYLTYNMIIVDYILLAGITNNIYPNISISNIKKNKTITKRLEYILPLKQAIAISHIALYLSRSKLKTKEGIILNTEILQYISTYSTYDYINRDLLNENQKLSAARYGFEKFKHKLDLKNGIKKRIKNISEEIFKLA
jgi:hypothetical protein